MPMTLFITSHQKTRLGPDSTKVFDIKGGTIGRAPDNDWVLPDPERFVSSRHAAINYRSGDYYLTDTSKNGVYVNDARKPIGSGNPVKLQNGDRLRIGEYRILVSVEEPAQDRAAAGLDAEDLDDSALIAVPGETDTATPLEPADQKPDVQPEPTGDHLTLAEEEPRAEPERASRGDDDWELFDLSDETGGAADTESADVAVVDRVASPVRQPPAAEDLKAFRALIEGLGLDPATIPPGSAAQLMRTCGGMLRGAISGIMEVLKSRTDLKHEFRLPQTIIEPSDNNPLKFSVAVDEALRHLLVEHDETYLGGPEAITASIEDIKQHQQAVLAATRIAFEEILERFDPEDLQQKFDRGLKRTALFGATNKMKYWDLYSELYQVMTQHAEGNFQRLFGEEFARAYQAEMEKLSGRKYKSAD